MKNIVTLDRFIPRDYQIGLLEALEDKGYRRIMAIWPRRCLSGNSSILMADGTQKELRLISAGEEILSWTGLGFEKDRIKHIWRTGIKETLRVQAKYIKPLIVSHDHKFAVKTQMDPLPRWVSAKDLTRYSRVLLHPNFCDPKRKRYNGCCFSRVSIEKGIPQLLLDIETEMNHNFIANGYVVHNSGKDLTAWNICIRELMRSTKTIYYIFPTFAAGRRILWDSITNDGQRMLDYLPIEAVDSRNEQLMRIRLKNGSVFQVIGSDSYDNTLIGTNPQGVVFSEFALSDPMAYSLVRPILSANMGWSIIASTPRGKNFLYDMYQMALQNPNDWFVSKLTVEDTKHISLDAILRERESGEMSEDLQMQEYYCDFTLGVEGAYYAKYMDNLRLKEQIGNLPWQPQHLVHTAWDIGVRDSTAIIFFQIVGSAIHIIDYYEKSKEGIEHYVDYIKSKPYSYGTHIGPHDIRNFEFSSGTTRWEKARQLGVTFEVADKLSIMDGIEAVRTLLPRCWIDERNCKSLLKALENYHQEYDSKKKIYHNHPVHDQWSHAADALRYLAIYLPNISDSMTPEDLQRLKLEARGISETSFWRRN